MTLKDTLRKLQEGPQLDAQAVVEEWQKAVGDFLGQIREFLKEYRESGAILIQDGQVQLREDLLGGYSAPNMALRAGPATIRVEPVGRVVVGATGRVDLYRMGRAAESQRVIALREGISPQGSRWNLLIPPIDRSFEIMSLPALLKSQERKQVPFDKENLESAVDKLLR
jgi:hypothetical protein